jgi:hypothetical protein
MYLTLHLFLQRSCEILCFPIYYASHCCPPSQTHTPIPIVSYNMCYHFISHSAAAVDMVQASAPARSARTLKCVTLLRGSMRTELTQ